MTAHEDLYDLMRSRRSVRRFAGTVPPRALIESILASAVTAPSASNKQPWRFLVVQNRGHHRGAWRQRCARRSTGSRWRSRREFEPSFRAYGEYFTRFEHAPLVIVPLFRALTVLSNLTGPQIAIGDVERIHAMERDSGLIGTSLAMQNLLLAAHAAGLGASGMTGPLVAADALREILRVPASWHIVALVPIGYPAEVPAPTARKPIARVTTWIE